MIDEIIVAARPVDIEDIAHIAFEFRKVSAVTSGGSERIDSVRKGIHACDKRATHYAIHDGARVLITPEQIEKAVNEILRKRSEKKGRLEKALEAKGIDRNKAAHSLFLSREELDQLIDKPQPQQDKLIDYLVTRVEAIKES